MRENSGKGDSNTGLLDPTIKEHEAKKGRSGRAPLHSERTDKERTSQRDDRGGGAR